MKQRRQPTNTRTNEFGAYHNHPKDGQLIFLINYDTGKIEGLRWASWGYRADKWLKEGSVFNFRWQAREHINRMYPDYKNKLTPEEIESLKSSL